MASVELGFVEERASWKLSSKFFPSKVGGFPAWLRLNNLPNRSDLICSSCKKPLVFLMQVYAPISDIETAFHRTIFIFMCKSGECNKPNNGENFIVLRSQLPRKNDFFSFDPPKYVEKYALDPSASKYQPLCSICGCMGTVKCPNCDQKYCSEAHQTYDLNSFHKNVCGKEMTELKCKKVINPYVLPEFELVTETEELPESSPERSEEQRMADFRQFMQSSKAPKEFQDAPIDDLDETSKIIDKTFKKFQKRVKIEPEQVLRYQRGQTPLWASSEHIPMQKDIPKCGCGADRIFEFQVMPQLLNHLSMDSVQTSIDWGSLFIYTCSKSCNMGIDSYVQEFLWKQDFSE